MSETYEKLQEQNDRYNEALTPSGDTKRAYMGEFSFEIETVDEDGNSCDQKVFVPWTTIKDIMKAINERATKKT